MSQANANAARRAYVAPSAKRDANVQRVDAAELLLRKAVPADREPIRFFFDTALRKDYFVRRGQLDELLIGRYHDVYLAELGGVLVGIAVKTRGTRLVNVLVHPAYRGLRIGQALIEASGATEVRAKTDMSSGDPRGFYEKLGFRSTGEFNAKGNIELMRRDGRSASPAKTQSDHGKTKPRRAG